MGAGAKFPSRSHPAPDIDSPEVLAVKEASVVGERLRAKSDGSAKGGPGPRSLAAHTYDVASMAAIISDRSPRLSEIAGYPTLPGDLMIAALFHDAGKAAYCMQRILYGLEDQRGLWDGYRHELLSAAVLGALLEKTGFASEGEESGDTLRRKRALALAVMTHHRSLNAGATSTRGRSLYDSRCSPEEFKGRLSGLEPRWDVMSQDLYRVAALLAEESGERSSRKHTLLEMAASLPESPFSLPEPFEYLADTERRYRSSLAIESRDYGELCEKGAGLSGPQEGRGISTAVAGLGPDLGAVFLRGCLVGGDHLASAAVDDGNYAQERIVEEPPAMSGVEVEDLHFVRDDSGAPNRLQLECADLRGSATLTAPTSAGKTEMAVLYGSANQNEQHTRTLFYILPFTASINAMSERLCHVQRGFFGESEVTMAHGRAGYFFYRWVQERLRDIANGEIDPRTVPGGSNYSNSSSAASASDLVTAGSEAARYAAEASKEMRSLSREMFHPVKVVTPHQLLSAFLGTKGWEQQITEMADGIFVVDEVHAYEPRIWGLLVGMLEILTGELGGRALVMSATLPLVLKERLQKALSGEPLRVTRLPEAAGHLSDSEALLKGSTPLAEVRGAAEPDVYNNSRVDPRGSTRRAPYPVKDASFSDEELRLYDRHLLDLKEGTLYSSLPRIRHLLAQDKRVMVVLNSVKAARECFELLKGYAANAVLVHGKLIDRDREKAEHQLRERGKYADLLVGTQAIEVSLDVDYEVLFTEAAPLDALLQRIGRLARLSPVELADLHKARTPARRYGVAIIHEGLWPGSYDIYGGSPEEAVIRDTTMQVLSTHCDRNPATEREMRLASFPPSREGVYARLPESSVRDLVEQVYHRESMREFLEVAEGQASALKRHYLGLEAGSENEQGEEYYASLTDQRRLIPYRFFEKHRLLLEKGCYLEAGALAHNVSDGEYQKLHREGKILREPDTHGFPHEYGKYLYEDMLGPNHEDGGKRSFSEQI